MLNLKDLANELDEQRDEDNEDRDPDRLAVLESLESELGVDLHIAARRGINLIAEDDFEDHAKDLAIDQGIDTCSWPGNCIDWSDAADELKHDYTVIEFDGETYYTGDL